MPLATRWRARFGHPGRVAGVVRGPEDDPELSDDELVARRTAWFESYTTQRNVVAPRSGERYTCPCCGHRTLDERGGEEICSRCDWQDDGQDDHDSDVVRGGPNRRLSLDDARRAFVTNGGERGQHRPPTPPS